MTWDEFKQSVDTKLSDAGLDGSANLTGIDLWRGSNPRVEIVCPPDNKRRVFLISWVREM